jgi:hypothetical protein
MGTALALAPAVATLTKETLQAMLVSKRKPVIVVLIALGVLGASLGMLGSSEAAAPLPEKRPSVAIVLPPAKGKLLRLLQERLKIAEKEFDARNRALLAGQDTLDLRNAASLRLLKAELELARNKAERVAAQRAQVKRATEAAKFIKEGYDVGRIRVQEYLQSEFHRLDAEVELERELSR